jgi:hypothetical protein
MKEKTKISFIIISALLVIAISANIFQFVIYQRNAEEIQKLTADIDVTNAIFTEKANELTELNNIREDSESELDILKTTHAEFIESNQKILAEQEEIIKDLRSNIDESHNEIGEMSILIDELEKTVANMARDQNTTSVTNPILPALNSNAKIVFVGDSITAWGSFSWLFADSGLEIINRGISGDTTAGLNNRINNIIDLSPSKIFLMIGVNDVRNYENLNVIRENYLKIFNTLDGSRSKIYIQSILPTGNSDFNANILILNDFLASEARNRKYVYIDL